MEVTTKGNSLIMNYTGRVNIFGKISTDMWVSGRAIERMGME